MLSSMAVLMTSDRREGFRKRYSVTPSQRRKSWVVLEVLCFGRGGGFEGEQGWVKEKERDSRESSKSYDRKARCPISTNNPPSPTNSDDYSASAPSAPCPAKTDLALHPSTTISPPPLPARTPPPPPSGHVPRVRRDGRQA